MQKFLFILILVGLLFWQCQDRSNNYVERYDSGKEFYICNLQAGMKHGTGTYFFEDGRVKGYDNWQGDQKHGQEVFFHKNGNVKSVYNYHEGLKSDSYVELDEDGRLLNTGQYLNGFLYRYQNQYYKGDLMRTLEYMPVGDTVVLNQYHTYNMTSGLDFERSNLFYFIRKTDSAKVNKPYSFSLFLGTPGYNMDDLNNIKVLVGDYDLFFNPTISGDIDTLSYEKNIPVINIFKTFSEPGLQYIRGIILNGHVYDEYTDGYVENRMYFECDVQVYED